VDKNALVFLVEHMIDFEDDLDETNVFLVVVKCLERFLKPKSFEK
jgi:hypothetical protein